MSNMRSLNATYRSRSSDIKKRILVGDEDSQAARLLAEYLYNNGYDTRTTSTANEAREIIEFWRPDVVVTDLTISLSVFRFFGLKKSIKRPPVIVTSHKSTPQVIEQICRAGAADVWEKPFSMDQMLPRLEDLLEPTERTIDPNDPLIAKTQELHLLNIFLKQATTSPGDSHCLHNLTRMVSLRTGALRTSIVQVANFKKGVVIASNDDAFVRGINLDLAKYPEILAVMQDHKAQFIKDWQNCEYLKPVQENLRKTPFEALAVFPLFIEGQFFGVMSLRLKRQLPHEANYVQKLGDLCSKIISLTLRHTAEAAAA